GLGEVFAGHVEERAQPLDEGLMIPLDEIEPTPCRGGIPRIVEVETGELRPPRRVQSVDGAILLLNPSEEVPPRFRLMYPPTHVRVRDGKRLAGGTGRVMRLAIVARRADPQGVDLRAERDLELGEDPIVRLDRLGGEDREELAGLAVLEAGREARARAVAHPGGEVLHPDIGHVLQSGLSDLPRVLLIRAPIPLTGLRLDHGPTDVVLHPIGAEGARPLE